MSTTTTTTITTTPPPKVWLITGCSSGFGFALAHHILTTSNSESNQPHKVIATSRTPSKTPSLVSQIESLGGTWLPLDVCSPEPELAVFIEKATAVYGRIDVLVNNAGYALLGAFESFSDAECRSQLNTNFFGPLALLRLLIPSMRLRRSGTLVTLSSTAGIEARPSRTLYSASKYAMEAVSEALSAELKPFNIRVLLVEPGAFRTRFAENFVSPERALPDDYRGTETEAVLAGVERMRGGGVERGLLGDVGKGVKAIFDVVEGRGWAEGMEEYLRLPLGRDGSLRWEGKLRSLRENLDGTERIWSRTGED
ncbi:putative short chain oxidoreductase/dehydrogenase [Rhexocercosporidium sp. MPI-PUGE-AT-0058]|nr:putative short chain oxidoreductase/dehydrogenase [Rhexocercosporidium sp. MPI-PUGE-AT-0058]